MGGRVLSGVLAASLIVVTGPALAGGGGFHGGAFRLPAGHPAPAMRWGSTGWRGGARGLPPVAGVIHERPGMRPFYSAYGHTGTSFVPFAGASRGGWRGYPAAGYGHVATGLRADGGRRLVAGPGGRWERGRFVGGRRYAIIRPGIGFVGGVYGGGFYAGGFGTDGAPTYQVSVAPAAPGGYGHDGTEVGGDAPYITELPLAATRTEAPLAPSPYGADGGYYAPQGDGAVPRVIRIRSRPRGACDCGSPSGAMPVIYRYGVGTAY